MGGSKRWASRQRNKKNNFRQRGQPRRISAGTSTRDLTENGHPPESDPCGSSTGLAQVPVLESAVSSASVTSSPPPPLLVDNCSTSPGFIQGEPSVESCGSEWGADEELPDLIIVDASVPAPASETATISGRMIISPAHFIQAIRDLDRHDCSSSVAGKFVYKSERQVGLWSEFKFSCDECHQVKTVTTDPIVEPTPLKDKSELGVNDSAVWAFTSIGSGYANLDEVLSVLEIPSMSKGAYCRREESLGKRWEELLYDDMVQAGKEEKRLAEEAGHICEDGTPYITVVVDGGWSHRSHGHRYSANSGLAVIIGARTKKLLYLGVKNKVCSTCDFYSRKEVPAKEHVCYKNWDKSSSAMESEIIVQGF
ncbi:unnamed protein product [Ixodes hexagonus]